ncbi:hypothetical protein IU367_12030 [Aeromonas bestiarum]|uniref:hypothetical protein n=1 Tax=Aeromonas bestiarum TaxID=105751 RepID=UPI0023796ABD|nr:hypothetical protein [Aeromonas bestiarum]WDL80829.1 hypothetical protein IU367_12030 [Aeromonas bestiarum]
MNKKSSQGKKPGELDVNGYPIPRYIVHGGPELAKLRGLPDSECQFFDELPNSEEHRKNQDAMWARWVNAGAEHIYP